MWMSPSSRLLRNRRLAGRSGSAKSYDEEGSFKRLRNISSSPGRPTCIRARPTPICHFLPADAGGKVESYFRKQRSTGHVGATALDDVGSQASTSDKLYRGRFSDRAAKPDPWYDSSHASGTRLDDMRG